MKARKTQTKIWPEILGSGYFLKNFDIGSFAFSDCPAFLTAKIHLPSISEDYNG